MWFLASWTGRIIGIAMIVVLGLAGWGVALYASDYGLEARVVSKNCTPVGRSTVHVETKLFGIDHTAPLDYAQCILVPENGFVTFHLRSGRTILYETEGGKCIWDTAKIPHVPCT